MGSAQSSGSTDRQNVDVGIQNPNVTNVNNNRVVESVSSDIDPSIKIDNNNNNNNNKKNNKNKNSITTSIEYHDPNRPAGGMPLVHYVCRKKKKSYEKCVSKWYSEQFLTGNGESLNQEDVCGPKFDIYRTCVLKGIKKEVWDKQNLPPPKAGSPLAEVSDIVDDDEEHIG